MTLSLRAPSRALRAAAAAAMGCVLSLFVLMFSAVAFSTVAFFAGAAVAQDRPQDIRFLRIGTGSISGVYFPVASTLASAISSPPGARSCESGGSCGVRGLIAVTQATLGSVANVKAIGSGTLESALVQADVAHDAYSGSGEFSGANRIPGLRAIANLYPEALHIVVRRESPIRSVRDLVGRSVSLDLVGSGTRDVALAVLAGYGIDPKSLRQVNSQVGPAADRIRLRNIDAFFFVGGYPVEALTRLARESRIRLIPVSGADSETIRAKERFLSAATIPAETYRGVGATETIAVGALWVVSEKVDANTVYGITRALWHPSTRRILDAGVPAARQIRQENALDGLALPLHPGAERYYREKGMLKAGTGNGK